MIRRAALTLLLVATACSPAALIDDLKDQPAPTRVQTAGPSSTTTTHPCQEDERCWDWRTMGNRCGRDNLSEPIRCMP